MGLDMSFMVEGTFHYEISYHRQSWVLWQWFVDNAQLDPENYNDQEIPSEVIDLFLKQSEEVLQDRSDGKETKLKKYFPLTGRASNYDYDGFYGDLINLRRAFYHKLAEDPETKFFLKYDY